MRRGNDAQAGGRDRKQDPFEGLIACAHLLNALRPSRVGISYDEPPDDTDAPDYLGGEGRHCLIAMASPPQPSILTRLPSFCRKASCPAAEIAQSANDTGPQAI